MANEDREHEVSFCAEVKSWADVWTGFDALAGSRTGTQTLRDAAAGLLMQWLLHGRA